MNTTTDKALMDEFGFHNPPLEKTDVCTIHGEFVSQCYMRNTWMRCPLCAKEKNDKLEQSKAENEALLKRRDWLLKIGSSGIPERFMNRTLSTYQPSNSNESQQKIFSFCKEYADDFKKNKSIGLSFFMLGMVGTGKTHLSIGIALEIMQNGYTSVFTSASKMLRSIKETYRKDSEKSEGEVIAIYSTCDLLIIDEVGVQRGSDYEKDMLFDVINERYENLRPTIILSNLTLEEIKSYLGERVFDRVRENGGKAFVLNWDSYRRAA